MAKSDTGVFGIAATFRTAPDVYHACEKVRDANYTRWDCYSPFPIHGIHHAMGMKRSRVPFFTLCGGVTGFMTGLAIVAYMNIDYPLIVGGKPYFSPIFPFPIFYELTILLAAFGTLGGMFLLNRLPRHHHPLFDYEPFLKTSDDTFMIVIESTDPTFNETEVRSVFEKAGGEDITVVEAKS
ncbi:MAG: DUF3341 domain-containing protein [Verrucomicrobiota bacterium]